MLHTLRLRCKDATLFPIGWELDFLIETNIVIVMRIFRSKIVITRLPLTNNNMRIQYDTIDKLLENWEILSSKSIDCEKNMLREPLYRTTITLNTK